MGRNRQIWSLAKAVNGDEGAGKAQKHSLETNSNEHGRGMLGPG